VPERERHRVASVWQTGNAVRTDLYLDPPERSITVSEHWDAEYTYSVVEVASDAATLVDGLPLIQSDEFPCGASGQSRLLVAAWLVSADEQQPRQERVFAADSILLRIDPESEDLALAPALIDLPGDRVESVLDEHWETVTAPRTSAGELADLLGLPAPGTPGFPEPDWETSYWTQQEIDEWWDSPGTLCS
jgi:hypothetical protein